MSGVARWALAPLVCLAASAIVSGCGGGSDDAKRVVRAKPSPPSSGAKQDLRRPGSASDTVKQYWTFIQQGAVPGALPLYDPKVVASVGVANFGGALSERQEAVGTTRLNVLDVERIKGGTLVSVEQVPIAGAKTRNSYYLVRGRNGRWQIRYDSFTEGILETFVAAQTQRRIAPNAKHSSRAALRAGDDAISHYRAVALR